MITGDSPTGSDTQHRLSGQISANTPDASLFATPPSSQAGASEAVVAEGRRPFVRYVSTIISKPP
jgi:hypothetical protein